MLVSVLLQ